ncbi:MAG TPA: hypothetical protein VF440_02935 [Novosphingobium sp.]
MSPSTRALARLAPLLLLPSLLVSGCASRGDFPSLALREAERVGGSAEPAPAASPAATPPPAPSGTLTQRLEQLVDQARTAHARFGERRGPAERTIGAGGGAVGSEGWASASIALATLESARADSMIALAQLDEIYAEAAVDAGDAGNPADRDAAEAARNQVQGWVNEEDAVLDRLRARIGG